MGLSVGGFKDRDGKELHWETCGDGGVVLWDECETAQIVRIPPDQVQHALRTLSVIAPEESGLDAQHREYAGYAQRGARVLITIEKRRQRELLMDTLVRNFPGAAAHWWTGCIRFPSGGSLRISADDELPTLAGLHFEYILLHEGAPQDMATRILSLIRKPVAEEARA